MKIANFIILFMIIVKSKDVINYSDESSEIRQTDILDESKGF